MMLDLNIKKKKKSVQSTRIVIIDPHFTKMFAVCNCKTAKEYLWTSIFKFRHSYFCLEGERLDKNILQISFSSIKKYFCHPKIN